MNLHDLIFGKKHSSTPNSLSRSQQNQKSGLFSSAPSLDLHNKALETKDVGDVERQLRPAWNYDKGTSSFSSYPRFPKRKRSNDDRVACLHEHLLEEYQGCPSRRHKKLRNPQECSTTLADNRTFPSHKSSIISSYKEFLHELWSKCADNRNEMYNAFEILKVLVEVDHLTFSEFHQVVELLRDTVGSTANITRLANMIFQSSNSKSSLQKVEVRFVMMKLFTDLLVADSKERIALSLIDRLSADRAFVGNSAFHSYVSMLHCISFLKSSNGSLSQVAQNPFALKKLIGRGVIGSSPNSPRNNSPDEIKSLRSKIEHVLRRSRVSEDLLDMHCIHLVLVHYEKNANSIASALALMQKLPSSPRLSFRFAQYYVLYYPDKSKEFYRACKSWVLQEKSNPESHHCAVLLFKIGKITPMELISITMDFLESSPYVSLLFEWTLWRTLSALMMTMITDSDLSDLVDERKRWKELFFKQSEFKYLQNLAISINLSEISGVGFYENIAESYIAASSQDEASRSLNASIDTGDYRDTSDLSVTSVNEAFDAKRDLFVAFESGFLSLHRYRSMVQFGDSHFDSENLYLHDKNSGKRKSVSRRALEILKFKKCVLSKLFH